MWVTDLTFVATWSGVAYVCFIVDAFSRMIVGWRVAAHMRTDMVLDALEMARWSRGTRSKACVALRRRQRSSRSIRYGERLAELGALPSIGTVGDSYDNALAETVNGLYKTELIRGPAKDRGTRRGRRARDPRLGALAQHQSLHGYLGDVPPAEFEAAFYAAQQTDRPWLESNNPSLHQNLGLTLFGGHRVRRLVPSD